MAVCAAAFSIEALVIVLTPLVMDEETARKWAQPRTTPFKGRFRQCFVNAVALKRTDVDRMTAEFEVVIDKRGRAVHYSDTMEEPVAHPVAGITNSVGIDFGLEGAQQAVRSMQDLYLALVQHPRPAAKRFADDHFQSLRHASGSSR